MGWAAQVLDCSWAALEGSLEGTIMNPMKCLWLSIIALIGSLLLITSFAACSDPEVEAVRRVEEGQVHLPIASKDFFLLSIAS